MFLAIVLPPKREVQLDYLELFPLTLDTFYRLVDWLHRGTDVPTHWLATALQSLFESNGKGQSKTPFQSRAIPQNDSPANRAYSPLSSNHSQRDVNVQPFVLELVSLWHKWATRLQIPIPSTECSVDMSTTAAGVLTRLKVAFRRDTFKLVPGGAATRLEAACGVLVCSSVDDARACCRQFFNAARESHSSLSNLIHNGAKAPGDLHIFSCMAWDPCSLKLELVLPVATIKEWSRGGKILAVFMFRCDAQSLTHMQQVPVCVDLAASDLGGAEVTAQCIDIGATMVTETANGGGTATCANTVDGWETPGMSAEQSFDFARKLLMLGVNNVVEEAMPGISAKERDLASTMEGIENDCGYLTYGLLFEQLFKRGNLVRAMAALTPDKQPPIIQDVLREASSNLLASGTKTVAGIFHYVEQRTEGAVLVLGTSRSDVLIHNYGPNTRGGAGLAVCEGAALDVAIPGKEVFLVRGIGRPIGDMLQQNPDYVPGYTFFARLVMWRGNVTYGGFLAPMIKVVAPLPLDHLRRTVAAADAAQALNAYFVG